MLLPLEVHSISIIPHFFLETLHDNFWLHYLIEEVVLLGLHVVDLTNFPGDGIKGLLVLHADTRQQEVLLVALEAFLQLLLLQLQVLHQLGSEMF